MHNGRQYIVIVGYQASQGSVYAFNTATTQFAHVQDLTVSFPRKFEFTSVNGCVVYHLYIRM